MISRQKVVLWSALIVLSVCFQSTSASSPVQNGGIITPTFSQIQTRLQKRLSGVTSLHRGGGKVSTLPKPEISVPHRLVAGGLSRCIAQMTLYPVDALRTLAQTRDGRTLADVGARTLVRGCIATSSFALFMGSIQFAVFGACRQYLGPVGASALGAAGSCIVSVPQEVIKQRLVTGVYSSFRDAVGTIYKKEGMRGFYSSWQPVMIRNVPFVVTTFTMMDFLKTKRLNDPSRVSDSNDLSVLENVAIGCMSALVGGIVTNPVDVVKTRMMTQAASNAVPYKSNINCFTTILKTEGPSTFFAGFKQRSVYICSLWGVTFGLNPLIHKQLSRVDSDGKE